MSRHQVRSSSFIDLDDKNITSCLLELDEIPIQRIQFRFVSNKTTHKLNIGSLMYSIRTKAKAYTEVSVDENTIQYSRGPALLNWAIALIEKFQKLRPLSIAEDYGRCAMFISWSDNNGHSEVLDSIQHFHASLIAYSHALTKEVSQDGQCKTVLRKIYVCVQLADVLFPDHGVNIHVGLSFPGRPSDTQGTPVPSEEILYPAFKAASAVFDSIHNFLLGDRSVPACYISSVANLWIVPDYYPLMSEKAIFANQLTKTRGTLLTSMRAEVISQITNTGMDIAEAFQRVMLTTSETRIIKHPGVLKVEIPVNSQLSEKETHKLCSLAHDCFLFMFILYSSSNSSPAGRIEWGVDSAIEPIIQGLRAIKWRSHSELEISFKTLFSQKLKKYLYIRDILTYDQSFSLLFGNFRYGKPPGQLIDDPAAQIAKKLKRLIDPDLVKLGFRELRAFHHHFKTTNNGLDVAASAAQHSIRTAVKNYTTGNHEENIAQTDKFFTSLGLEVKRFEDAENAIITQAGGCDKNDEIIARTGKLENETIQPDCRNYIGCLFCTHYLVHFNTGDARKLLSIVYLIEQIRQAQIDNEEFIHYYGPTLYKINWLILEMEKNEELKISIREIRIDIFENENLSPYWERKLRIYSEIGVIS